MVPSRESDRCSLAWLLIRQYADRTRSASVLVIAGGWAAGDAVPPCPVPVFTPSPCWLAPAPGLPAGDRRMTLLRGNMTTVMAAVAARSSAAAAIRRPGDCRLRWYGGAPSGAALDESPHGGWPSSSPGTYVPSPGQSGAGPSSCGGPQLPESPG